MDSLGNILKGRLPDEPPEIKLIKRYVHNNFKQSVEVVVRERDIIITVPGASFANTLRLQTGQLKEAAATSKRLVFRISQ